MPVRTRRPAPSYNRHDLVDALWLEWQQRRQDSDDPNAPLILIEEDAEPASSPVHLMVVWDRWSEVPEEDRSTLILEAFGKTNPTVQRLARVTLAMGLTKAEAATMGLPTQ